MQEIKIRTHISARVRGLLCEKGQSTRQGVVYFSDNFSICLFHTQRQGESYKTSKHFGQWNAIDALWVYNIFTEYRRK